MPGRDKLWTITALVVMLAGCNRREPGVAIQPDPPDGALVAFELAPVRAGNDSQEWRGIYTSRGKVAKFRIELGPATDSDTKAGQEFKIKFGEGRFIPEAGSDATVLLDDIRKALQARAHPPSVLKKTSVPFTYASIGENLSRSPGGGFGTKPPGDRRTMKIFLGEGDEEGQVFLNLNPKDRKGEFSMKDPEYGDLVLLELARVL